MLSCCGRQGQTRPSCWRGRWQGANPPGRGLPAAHSSRAIGSTVHCPASKRLAAARLPAHRHYATNLQVSDGGNAASRQLHLLQRWRAGCDKAVLASPAIAVARDTAHCLVCCRSVRPVTASGGITHALGWTCSACGRTGSDDTQRYVCEGTSCGRTVCAGCFSGGSSGNNNNNNNSNNSNSTAAGGPAVLRGTAAYVAMGQRADKFADLLANRLALHVIRRGVARDKHNCAALMGVAINLRRFAADAVRRGLFIDSPSHATQTTNLLNMAAFQTMSGELLRKKGSYLFGDRVENKVVRSGKVAGKVATHGTRLKQHHVGSKAQSSAFYQMYPDASVLVR